MRTVFLGTSEFAVTILRRLHDSPHAPALVVTRPDRPRGRGRKLAAPPVAGAARELGLDVYQPESVNSEEAVARIGLLRPEALCLCAFGALIKEPLLSDHLIFNVHPSLLPRWRGAAPVERAIMAGDTETGVTIMRLTAGLDSGPICAAAPEPIAPEDTYGTLAPRLAELGGRLLLESLSTEPEWVEQDDAHATYAEKIEADDRRLDPVGRSAPELERVVRALDPHIGAFALLDDDNDGLRLGVHRAAAVEGGGLAPGAVSLDGPVPVLGCASGALELRVVQPPGRRAMSGGDYLRGLHR
jgi:methionyl-tRNA formyltransferase